MGYSDQPFSQRIHSLGDAAEAVYLQVAPLGKSERFGWRRPAVSMAAMSAYIRHAPDYYASTGWLVEVMGVGSDGIVKFKEDKYNALREWNKQQKVALFVSNSAESTWVLAPFDVVKKAVARARRAGRVDAFANDGNVFFAIPYQELRDDEKTIGGDS